MDQATEGERGSKEDKNQDKKHTKKHIDYISLVYQTKKQEISLVIELKN